MVCCTFSFHTQTYKTIATLLDINFIKNILWLQTPKNLLAKFLISIKI